MTVENVRKRWGNYNTEREEKIEEKMKKSLTKKTKKNHDVSSEKSTPVEYEKGGYASLEKTNDSATRGGWERQLWRGAHIVQWQYTRLWLW